MSTTAPELELVLEPAVSPSGPVLWNLRQQKGSDATIMTGKRSDMARVMGDTLGARLREGNVVIAKVYGKDGTLEEHAQYNPDGSGKKLPLTARGAEGFGRKCSTLGAPTAEKSGKKGNAGKVLGALKAALEELETKGKAARRKANSAIKKAREANLGNGSATKRDELIAQLEAKLAKLAKEEKPKKSAKPTMGKSRGWTHWAHDDEMPKVSRAKLPPEAVRGLKALEAKTRSSTDGAMLTSKEFYEWPAGSVVVMEDNGHGFYIHPPFKAKPEAQAKPKKEAKPKAEAKPKKEAKPKPSGNGEETYREFAARLMPSFSQKYGHKEAMVKLGEAWQMEKAARRQTAATGQRPTSAPPAVPAKTASSTSSTGKAAATGKATGKPGGRGTVAPLPDDPNLAQLSMFLKGRSTHAST